MSRRLRTSRPGWLWIVLALGLSPLACRAQSAAPPPGALADCAALTADAERLACYDKLARRAAPAAAAPPRAPAAARAPPAPPAATPAAAAAPSPGVAPASAVPAAAATPAPPPSTESFGLYPAEHPKAPPVSPSVEARVLALGRSASGRMTVSLEGGALWELAEADDPLLTEGDTVSITRAAFGSYLMRTPSKRLLRVRRVR